MVKRFSLFIVLIFIVAGSKAQLIVDSSFGTNGYFIPNYNYLGTFCHKLHEMPNGDLLSIGTDSGEIRIWKYDASGQSISSYGTNGIAQNPALDAEEGKMYWIYDYALYDNDKVLIAVKLFKHNSTHFDSSKYTIALVSFNADGSINTGFNGTGYRLDQPAPNHEYAPYALCVDEVSQRIYVGSEAYVTGQSSCPMGTGRWCVSKYKFDGSTDLAFNNIGYVQEKADLINQGNILQSPLAGIRDMRLRADGSLRVVGRFHNFDKAYFDMVLKSDGTFDNSFGIGGRTTYAVPYSVLHYEKGTWCTIFPDQTVLFRTQANESTLGQDSVLMRMVKHKSDGTADNSFGINGHFEFKYPTHQNPTFTYNSNNDMLLSYYRQYGTNDQKIEFLSLKENGSIDASFGTNGYLQTHPIMPDIYANASVVFDAIWDKDESHLYLTAPKSYAGTNSHAIFRYLLAAPLSLENFVEEKIAIYPNPVHAGARLHIKENLHLLGNVILQDLNGRYLDCEVQSIGSETEIRIPSDLNSGLYFLRFSNIGSTHSILVR